MLLDSAGDEDPKWQPGIILECANDTLNQVLHRFPIVALIESVDDNNRSHPHQDVACHLDGFNNQFLELVRRGYMSDMSVVCDGKVDWISRWWCVTI